MRIFLSEKELKVSINISFVVPVKQNKYYLRFWHPPPPRSVGQLKCEGLKPTRLFDTAAA